MKGFVGSCFDCPDIETCPRCYGCKYDGGFDFCDICQEGCQFELEEHEHTWNDLCFTKYAGRVFYCRCGATKDFYGVHEAGPKKIGGIEYKILDVELIKTGNVKKGFEVIGEIYATTQGTVIVEGKTVTHPDGSVSKR